MQLTRLAVGFGVAAALRVLPVSPAFAQQSSLSVTATGAQEVPGPGEDGATAAAKFAFDAATGTITYTVVLSGNAEPAVMGHIHEAAAGAAGPVVVPLDAAAINAGTEATVTADPALVAEIVANPQDYYLNLHSAAFPNGFVRGQLADPAIAEAGPVGAPAPTSVPAGDGSSADSSLLLGTTLAAVGAVVVAAGVARRRRGTLG